MVKVLTNLLEDREMDMPKGLRVVLRAYKVEGAELPAYGLTDHYFVMVDGTVGSVSLFDDFYTNTFDGKTFDSPYLRIEGIDTGDIKTTVKKEQTVWPEKTDETHATDLNGDKYEQVEDVWGKVEEAVAA